MGLVLGLGLGLGLRLVFGLWLPLLLRRDLRGELLPLRLRVAP